MLNFSALDTAIAELEISNLQLNDIIDYEALSTDNPIVDEDTRQVIEQSFLYLTGHPKEAEDLSFGDNTWRIKIGPTLLKTSVVTSVMIGLLHASGATPLGALVLPAVLPLIIDIETIRLTVKDNLILSEMRLNANLRDSQFAPRVIYNELSADLQDEISYSEFLDVLDSLCITGNAERDERTGLFQLNEKRRLKIVFE